MTSKNRTIGVILAGGTGTRVGLSIPKQLIKIAGKPVMEHTISLFQAVDAIDEIYVLMHPDHVAAAEEIAARYPKVTKVLAGGVTRNGSTQAALDALAELPNPDTKVLLHDAVRPLLDASTIVAIIDALDTHDAVDVAIPSADTIIEVNDADEIAAIPPRAMLRRGQTPQAFRLHTIREAYRRAWEDPDFVATDDCSVVFKYLPDAPIAVVKGTDQNMKITEPIDVFIADKLFQIGSTLAPRPKNADGYAGTLAGKVMVIFGGSYGIGADIAELAKGFGATVCPFSRSTTNTHVENAADVERDLAQVAQEHGHIDYVILTAGVLKRGPLADTPMEDIIDSVNVDYMAPVFVARAAYPYLRQSHGHLVFFTSSSYTRGRSTYSIYSSTKAAVVNFTQALADEWSSDGIQVNVINPERTGTPMRTKAFGVEPKGSLLASSAVALTTLDVLLSNLTGNVIDVRREEPSGTGMSRSETDADRIAAALAKLTEDAGKDD